MNKSDTKIKRSVDAFVPDPPEGYTKMIKNTVAELNTKVPQRSRKLWKPFAAAAAVIAALIVTSAAVFGARPALAAEVSGISSIVYAVSPKRTVNDSDRERIELLLDDAFRSLAFCDYEAASRCFRGDCISERGNYLSAAYLDYLVAFSDCFPDSANAAKLEIEDLQAEQKAFRYTAHVTLNLVSRDGTKTSTEDCTVQLWENTKGVFIESIGFGSEGYRAFAAMYESTFGAVPTHEASVRIIPVDSSFMSYVRFVSKHEGARQRVDRLNHMLATLDVVTASPEEKAVREALIKAELEKAEEGITPESISAEQIAAELMYRYWLGRKTGEVCDFSDITERNEETDLFFWDAVLEAEKVKLGVLKPLVSVKYGYAEITEILENTDGIIKARFSIHTEITDGISQGVGEEIVLTLRKDAAGFTVIGFDREVGDGLYTYSLKPLASEYKAAGYSWQDAGQMAYDAVHAQLERDAQWPSND